MKYNYIILALTTLGLISCKKFVDTVSPVNQLVSETVLNNDNNLSAALNGVYGILNNNTSGSYYYPALFSDEVQNPNGSSLILDAQQNSYDSNEDYGFFSGYYSAIYNANILIQATENPAPGLSATVVKKVRGEALFLRAYCYFHLVNYYGNVPLILNATDVTNVTENALKGNSPSTEIYQSIISDLQLSVGLLEDAYTTTYRWHVNKAAAQALLSKVYLYTSDWNNAATTAGQVISSPLYSLNQNLNNIFLANSTETIWQLYNVNGFSSVSSGYVPANTATVNYRIRPTLLSSFESGDQRRAAWTRAGTGASASFSYPYKYKLRAAATGNNAEYYIQLRLADIYLVRAEALARQNNITDATSDLLAIRRRAGLLTPISFNNATDLLAAIAAERQKELMFENANRWFDLKRTERGSAVLAAIKTNFQARSLLLPFPVTILQANPNLKQNDGY